MINTVRKQFTQIPNELINDVTLHPTARFLFCYLSSKPEEWEYKPSDIEKRCRISKETRLKYMTALKDAGWITSTQKKGVNGEFGSLDIVLHATKQPREEIPATEPREEIPTAEKNGSGKTQPLSNTKINSNTELISNTDVSANSFAETLFDTEPLKKEKKVTMFKHSEASDKKAFDLKFKDEIEPALRPRRRQ